MARKSRSLPKLQITSSMLPGVLFFDVDSLCDDAAEAMAERQAFDEFDANGCEVALQIALQDLRWSYRDIRAYIEAPVNARREMVQIGYGLPLAMAA